MEINEQIKNIIEAKGITKKRLSIMAGVTERTVIRFIKEQRQGNVDTLMRFADVLGYEVVLIPKE